MEQGTDAYTDSISVLAGGIYEAGHRTYAVLFWDWNDASFVYSGDDLDFDFYYRVPGTGVSSVLLLTA